MESTIANPKPKRRWLQFSLKGLFVFILVFAALLAWAKHEARKQAVAVAALEKLGCEVVYAYEEPPTLPERLRQLLGEEHFRNVIVIYGHDSQVGNADLVNIEGLYHVYHLSLDRTQVTDTGLSHLRGLTQLKDLWVQQTSVSEAGVKELKKSLPNLLVLYSVAVVRPDEPAIVPITRKFH